MVHTCVVLPLSIAEFGFMIGTGWDVSEQIINVRHTSSATRTPHYPRYRRTRWQSWSLSRRLPRTSSGRPALVPLSVSRLAP